MLEHRIIDWASLLWKLLEQAEASRISWEDGDRQGQKRVLWISASSRENQNARSEEFCEVWRWWGEGRIRPDTHDERDFETCCASIGETNANRVQDSDLKLDWLAIQGSWQIKGRGESIPWLIPASSKLPWTYRCWGDSWIHHLESWRFLKEGGYK